MLRSVVEAAGDLNVYAQVALVLFVAVFVSVLVREKMRSKKEVTHLENLPLRDGTEGE
jgi:hypothetical protein